MLTRIREFRKELHQYPELSGMEFGTRQRIKNFIRENCRNAVFREVGGQGLAVIYDFSEGLTVMIRCELDALPIEEVNTFAHRSRNNGVSHKCGHDGHMAIVAGLCLHITNKSYKGKVILLFQPAEETGKGAEAVMRDPEFEQLKPDYVFALHNLPGAPLSSVIIVQNYFSATVQSFSVKLTGKQAHASEPENGTNPSYAIGELINRFNLLQINTPEKKNFSLLTPVHLSAGSKDYGISAGTGEMHYTIRTWDEEEMTKLKENIIQIISEVCNKWDLTYNIAWFDYFPASKNDSECNNYIHNAASSAQLRTINRPIPLKFGEDFGWYSHAYRTAMFGLGAGENSPALHHAEYDFPDELLSTGITMFTGILDQILGKEQNM